MADPAGPAGQMRETDSETRASRDRQRKLLQEDQAGEDSAAALAAGPVEEVLVAGVEAAVVDAVRCSAVDHSARHRELMH